MATNNVDNAVEIIKQNLHSYGLLHDKIISLLNRDPDLSKLIHSYKSRMKDITHLKDKIIRKNAEDDLLEFSKKKGHIHHENIMKRITDICGIRILHLYIGQFESIHKAIMKYEEEGEISLFEDPKAYTWDPEFSHFFKKLGLDTSLKESFYTSVHYVFKPRADSNITCEVQVRTLFEEVWGEIDHTFNYPVASSSKVVQEQLKVLARVVGAGTKLSDSIFELHKLDNTQRKASSAIEKKEIEEAKISINNLLSPFKVEV
ncbi:MULTISPECIES: RelA/SpoT domain-containing protein [unclassified Aeromonas]|uniref:RelA/SpoT domain-containing protein n=1 Tax=unclassified Aeromonas TaxID=257493 RepID=UPI003527BD03